MAQRREVGLRRGVGLGLLASVLFVNVAAAVFISLGVTAREALGVTPLAFVVSGLVFLLTLLGYVEGIAMLPQAGGAAGFARRGLGELPSFLAAWALILDYLILLAMCAFFAIHYVGSIPGLGALLGTPWDELGASALVVGVAAFALRGVKAAARVAVVVSAVALVSQVLLAVLGLALVFKPDALARSIDIGVTPTWGGILFSLPVAMIGFTGLDSVANLGAELDKPGRDVPRPLIWSAVTSVLVFVVMSVLALNALPIRGSGAGAHTELATEAGFLDRPLIGIIEALPLPAGVIQALDVLFAVLAAMVLFLAATYALGGLSRLSYFMAVHRQAPSALARIDREYSVPRVGIALLAMVAIGVLLVSFALSQSALVLAQLYAFGATFSFVLANAAVLKLRWTEPGLDRPFRAPFTVMVRGREVPISVVLGLITSLGMWLIVLFTHEAARALGLTWMIVGFVLYGTYRLTHGLPLRALAEARTEVRLKFDATEYRRILVAVRPERGSLWGAGDAEMIGLANKLLDREEGAPGEVAVMLVHELPLIEPLDAPIGDVERVTTERLALIRAVTERLDLRLASTITRARAAGRAICREAERRQCDAVLLATRNRPRHGDQVFGKCVGYVLRHAPCDVLILSLPEQSLRNARSEE